MGVTHTQQIVAVRIRYAQLHNERFYHGSPCRTCAGTQRYTASNTCVVCAKARQTRRYDLIRKSPRVLP